MAMLEIRNVQKTFRTDAKPGLHAGIFHRPGARKAAQELQVLRGVDLTVEKGDVVAILGPSGSGKTTLLRCLNFLETADAGQLILDGESFDLAHANRADIARLRKKTAFVFQSYNLIPHQTVLANVELALTISGISGAERKRRATEALQKVGLGNQLHKHPSEMSGGQMQRVAIARALVNNPAVILADEATGNLDTRTSFEILVLFQKLHAEGRTLIFVTHNPEIAQYSSRNIRLRDGHVVEDTINPQILSAAAALAALPKNDED